MGNRTITALIVAFAVVNVGPLAYWGYQGTYMAGYTDATKEADEREATVSRELKEIGLCEFPEAFAKAHRCPVRVIRTDQ